MIRVLLAHTHELIRGGVRHALTGAPNLQVVGESDDDGDLLGLCDSLAPDVIVMGLHSDTGRDLEALESVRSRFPAIGVVLMADKIDEYTVWQAVMSGAKSILLSSVAAKDLAYTVLLVARGVCCFAPDAHAHIQRFTSLAAKQALPSSRLSPRQLEIFEYLGQGLSSKEIAFRLGLSVSTVDNHRAEVLRKLGLRDVVELVRYAVENGFAKRAARPVLGVHRGVVGR